MPHQINENKWKIQKEHRGVGSMGNYLTFFAELFLQTSQATKRLFHSGGPKMKKYDSHVLNFHRYGNEDAYSVNCLTLRRGRTRRRKEGERQEGQRVATAEHSQADHVPQYNFSSLQQ